MGYGFENDFVGNNNNNSANNDGGKKLKKLLRLVVIGLIALITLISSITIVPAGHTSVITTLGKVSENVLQEGIHLKAPFVQTAHKIDNRIVKLEVSTEAFSQDLQPITTVLSINYRVDPNKSYSIYKNVGPNYEQVLIVPAVNEVLKAITAAHTAEETVTNRTIISDGLVEGLSEKLSDIGLYITDVNIIDFDFSDKFLDAIEEKQVAQQQLLKAETEKQTKITNAAAEAESAKIKAQGEAEANRLMNESLTDRVIENKKIEKWNGELPKVTGGNALVSLD